MNGANRGQGHDRYERRADLHLALTTLACAVICHAQTKVFVPNSYHCQERVSRASRSRPDDPSAIRGPCALVSAVARSERTGSTQSARVVIDETSVRIDGGNAYHLEFHAANAVASWLLRYVGLSRAPNFCPAENHQQVPRDVSPEGEAGIGTVVDTTRFTSCSPFGTDIKTVGA